MLTKLRILFVTFTPLSCHLCYLNDIDNLQKFVLDKTTDVLLSYEANN
jgi:DUF1365 family protein